MKPARVCMALRMCVREGMKRDAWQGTVVTALRGGGGGGGVA